MMTSIALAMALQGVPATPAATTPTFAEILEAANRAWYELPEVTTKCTVKTKEKEIGTTAEIRDGKRMCFALATEGELRLQVRSDGDRTLFMDFGSRSYRLESTPPRPSWADRETKKAPDPEPDTFRFQFDTSQGLILNLVGRAFRVTHDKIDVQGSYAGRQIFAEAKKPSPSGKAESRITFNGWLDTKKGFFRKAIVIVVNGDEPDKTMTLDWESDDKAEASANYNLNPPGLESWTKVDGERSE